MISLDVSNNFVHELPRDTPNPGPFSYFSYFIIVSLSFFLIDLYLLSLLSLGKYPTPLHSLSAKLEKVETANARAHSGDIYMPYPLMDQVYPELPPKHALPDTHITLEELYRTTEAELLQSYTPMGVSSRAMKDLTIPLGSLRRHQASPPSALTAGGERYTASLMAEKPYGNGKAPANPNERRRRRANPLKQNPRPQTTMAKSRGRAEQLRTMTDKESVIFLAVSNQV
jgi:hypothetical protein